MRVALCLVAALACLAAGVTADASWPAPPSCGAEGLPGGWEVMTTEDADAVAQDIAEVALATLGANLTTVFKLPGVPSVDNVTFTAIGCQQVVAGTNFNLLVNTSATVAGTALVLGTSAQAFRPLPVDGKEQPIVVQDLDLEWASVNGTMVVSDDGNSTDTDTDSDDSVGDDDGVADDSDDDWEDDLLAAFTKLAGNITTGDDMDDMMDDMPGMDMDAPGDDKDDGPNDTDGPDGPDDKDD